MNILVTGSTGTVGSLVVRGLAAQGAHVHAMTRDPNKATFPAGVIAVKGDMTDIPSMRAALKEVDTLFLLNAVVADEVTQAPLLVLRDETTFAALALDHGAVEWPGTGVGVANEWLYALAHGLPRPMSLAEAEANGEDLDAVRARVIQEYEDHLLNPYIAAERGYVDAVIMPSETRRHIVRGLRQLRTKRESLPPKKHGNIPL